MNCAGDIYFDSILLFDITAVFLFFAHKTCFTRGNRSNWELPLSLRCREDVIRANLLP